MLCNKFVSNQHFLSPTPPVYSVRYIWPRLVGLATLFHAAFWSYLPDNVSVKYLKHFSNFQDCQHKLSAVSHFRKPNNFFVEEKSSLWRMGTGSFLIQRAIPSTPDCLSNPQLKYVNGGYDGFHLAGAPHSVSGSSDLETDNKVCGKYLSETTRALLFWKALLSFYFQRLSTTKGLLAECSWLVIKMSSSRKRL